MIYIWDNNGECSDRRILIIASEASRGDIEKYMRVVGRADEGCIVASIEVLEWYEGESAKLSDVEPPSYFFDQPAENPILHAATMKFWDGREWHRGPEHAAAVETEWQDQLLRAKYKVDQGMDYRLRWCGNPRVDYFDSLTSTVAREILAGWKTKPQGFFPVTWRAMRDAFAKECAERGLL